MTTATTLFQIIKIKVNKFRFIFKSIVSGCRCVNSLQCNIQCQPQPRQKVRRHFGWYHGTMVPAQTNKQTALSLKSFLGVVAV